MGLIRARGRLGWIGRSGCIICRRVGGFLTCLRRFELKGGGRYVKSLSVRVYILEVDRLFGKSWVGIGSV